MASLLAQWSRSGQTAAAFCRRHGIKPQKLWYWKRVLGAGHRPRGAGASFVPVRLVTCGTASGSPVVEIVLASGIRVLVGEGVGREQLGEVLGALEGRC
jgi:transposase-like protein